MFFDCFTITQKLGMWGKSYFWRKRLKFRMRVKFRNKSSEWKDRKILNRWELIQAHIWLQGGHEGHDGTNMFQVENGNLTQALFHLTRNIHILTQMNGFFFFLFCGQEKSITFFFSKNDVCLFCWWWWRDLYLTEMNVLKSLCLTLNSTRVSSKCFSKTLKISFYKVKWT